MHIVPKKVYFAVFATLLILTFVTRYVAEFDFGGWNTIIALAIAVTKASLVILYFMHLRYSDRLTWIVLVGGLFWLGILLTYSLNDYFTRGILPITR